MPIARNSTTCPGIPANCVTFCRRRLQESFRDLHRLFVSGRRPAATNWSWQQFRKRGFAPQLRRQSKQRQRNPFGQYRVRLASGWAYRIRKRTDRLSSFSTAEPQKLKVVMISDPGAALNAWCIRDSHTRIRVCRTIEQPSEGGSRRSEPTSVAPLLHPFALCGGTSTPQFQAALSRISA